MKQGLHRDTTKKLFGPRARAWLIGLLVIGTMATPRVAAETNAAVEVGQVPATNKVAATNAASTAGVTAGAVLEEVDEFVDFEDFEEVGDEDSDAAESSGDVSDPLQAYNVFMYRFNDWLYVWILRPVAKAYAWVLPERVRVSIGRALQNLRTPVSFVNAVLQLEFRKAGRELGRFVINSTVGLLGFFDPAAKYLKWYPANEDFGLTLGHYGVGDGFPLVLPFLGPSNPRDSIALVPQLLLNPLTYVRNISLSLGVGAADLFNTLSLSYELLDEPRENALDPYTYFRDAYKQNRDKRIKD